MCLLWLASSNCLRQYHRLYRNLFITVFVASRLGSTCTRCDTFSIPLLPYFPRFLLAPRSSVIHAVSNNLFVLTHGLCAESLA